MIELKDISKKYGNNVTALDGVNLQFEEGKVIVLKGVSGSGKSTILSLIAGILKPTSGEVIVNEKKISKLADHFASTFRRDNIGFIFQKYNLIPSLSVQDNILLPLIPKNMDKEQMFNSLSNVLQILSIKEKRNIFVKNLSGGEQQRVAIARAIINNPQIIIADEPTANLDESLSLEFIEILRGLKEKRRTIVIATHDPLFFNLDFVDQIIEIKKGKVD